MYLHMPLLAGSPPPLPTQHFPGPRTSPMAAGSSAADERWWAKLHEPDPISLEPISALAYPPFELRADPLTRTKIPMKLN